MAKLLNRDFNESPYWDDFNASIENEADELDILRVLFRPAVAVQTRELTQIQSLLQNQIGRFANHVFEEGSPVLGGKLTTNTNVKVYALAGTESPSVGDTVSNNAADTTERGRVVFTETAGGTNYIYVDTITTEFADGTTITNGTDTFTLAATNASSDGALASITDGIFYVSGFFIRCFGQTVSLSRTTSTPSCSIGLIVSDRIITENGDNSSIVLDNASGTKNEKAPGAHRYQGILTLSRQEVGVTGEAYIELAELQDGELNRYAVNPVYAELGHQLAHRTFEESGNYTLEPFAIEIDEHASDDDKLSVSISEGQAYVRGYERDLVGRVGVDVDRARDTVTFEDLITRTRYGHYFEGSFTGFGEYSSTGMFDVSGHPEVDLHCVLPSSIDRDNYTLTRIGTANIINIIKPESFGQDDTAKVRVYTRNRQYAPINQTTFNAENTGDGVPTAITAGGTTFNISITGDIVPNNAYKGMRITVNEQTFTIVSSTNTGSPTTNAIIIEIDGAFAEDIAAGEATYSILPAEASIRSIGSNGTGALNTFFQVDEITEAAGKQNLVFPLLHPYVRSMDSQIASDGSVPNNDANRQLTYYKTDLIENLSVGVRGTTNKVLTLANPVDRTLYFNQDPPTSGSLSIPRSDAAHYIGVVTSVSGLTLPDGVTAIAAWASGTTYTQNDLVTHAGGVYEKNATAARDNTVNPASDTNAWELQYSIGDVITFDGGTYSSSFMQLNLDNNKFAVGTPVTVLAPRYATVSERTKTRSLLQAPSAAGANNFLADGYNGTTNTVYASGAITGGLSTNLYTSDVYDFKVVSLANITFLASELVGSTPKNAYDVTDADFTGVANTAILNISSKYNQAYYDDDANDITEHFVLDTGQRDYIYDYASVSRKHIIPTDAATTELMRGPFVVHFSHYEHGSGDYFSVDSYRSSGSVVAYDDIPTYHSPSDDTTYRLADALDFRKSRANGTTGTLETTNASIPNPTLNLEIANGYDYYVPRKDKIVLEGLSGKFTVVKGEPSETPTFPAAPVTSMTLFELSLPAYTFEPGDVEITPLDHRRYTMSDIAQLEKRLTTLESRADVAESRTEAAKAVKVNTTYETLDDITDFYVNHKNGAVDTEDYVCAMDPINKFSRPTFEIQELSLGAVRSIPDGNPPDLTATGTSYDDFAGGGRQAGMADGILTLPYTEKELLKQDQPTRTRKVNPYPVGNYNGFIRLTGNRSGIWYDRETKPKIKRLPNPDELTESIIEGYDKEGYGSEWQEWLIRWVGVDSDTLETNPFRFATTSKEDHSRIIDTTIQPYIKSSDVAFTAYNLRPGVSADDLHLYIDGNEETVTWDTTATNEQGTISGTFSIPASTYTSGLHTVRIMDAERNVLADCTTKAETVYYASGLPSRGRTSTIRPDERRTSHAQSGTYIPSYLDLNRSAQEAGKWVSPLAQTFEITSNRHPNGVFLTSVDFEFTRTPTGTDALPITVSIRPLEQDGYPSQRTILSGSEVSRIATTDNGTFTFHHPVYLPVGRYALCLETNSSDYEVETSVLGTATTSMTEKVETATRKFGFLLLPLNTGRNEFTINEQLVFTLKRAEFDRERHTVKWDATPVANSKVDQFIVVSDDMKIPSTDIRWYENHTGAASGTLQITANETTVPPASDGDVSAADIGAIMETTDRRVSPIIDLDRIAYAYITNTINNASVGLDDIEITAGGENYAANNVVFVSTTANSAFTAPHIRLELESTSIDSGGAVLDAKTDVSIVNPDDVHSWLGGETIAVEGGDGTGLAVNITKSETNSGGGTTAVRYITREFTAAEPFNYIEVAVDGVRRHAGDIVAYYRVLSDSDSDVITNKNWVRMYDRIVRYSNSPDEYRTNSWVGTTGFAPVSYKNGAATFNTFTSYQIKLAMYSPFDVQDYSNTPKARRIYVKTSTVS